MKWSGKATITVIAALFVLCAAVVLGQQSSSATVNFSILRASSSGSRQIVDSDPYFRHKNDVGNLLSAVECDSAALVTAFGPYQHGWTWIVVDTFTVTSAVGSVVFRRFDVAGGGYEQDTLRALKGGPITHQNFTGINDLDVVLAPFDSAAIGDMFTIGYLTTAYQ